MRRFADPWVWAAAVATVAIATSGCGDRAVLGRAERDASMDARRDPPADLGPDTSAECASGQTRCGEACVDIATDALHCGGCDLACEAGIACLGGVCQTCGGVGERCCSGDACAAGSRCVDSTCVDCGGIDESCCPDGSCDAGAACGEGNVCAACGGSEGDPCCPDESCRAPLACVAGTCASCGARGMACCPGELCAARLSCISATCVCEGGDTESSCTDAVDNDCDRAADCADSDCPDGTPCDALGRTCSAGMCGCAGGTSETMCSGAADDDCDGAIDCADSDCEGRPCDAMGGVCTGGGCACPAGGGPEGACGDGLDNDCDGAIDCADSDCAGETCDDGMFCNGTDTCGGSTCSVHSGDPCGGMSTCDEATDRCVGCAVDADCGGPMVGPWSTCDYASTCDQNASRARSVTTFRCMASACVGTPTNETEACTRDTGGTPCGPTSCDPFGACGGFSGVCGESGTQTRGCTYQQCDGGSCGTRMGIESMPCTRDTEGTMCGATSCTGFGACTYPSTCSESGARERTCTDQSCAAGRCGGQERTESDPTGCTRTTTGTSCGTFLECGGGSCRGCGGSSEPCCATGSPCRPGFFCDAGTCRPCGADGQPCCAGSTCNSGLGCDYETNRCGPCGDRTQVCCAGDVCDDPNGATCETRGRDGTVLGLDYGCVPCGSNGEPCCPGIPCLETGATCQATVIGSMICRPPGMPANVPGGTCTDPPGPWNAGTDPCGGGSFCRTVSDAAGGPGNCYACGVFGLFCCGNVPGGDCGAASSCLTLATDVNVCQR